MSLSLVVKLPLHSAHGMDPRATGRCAFASTATSSSVLVSHFACHIRVFSKDTPVLVRTCSGSYIHKFRSLYAICYQLAVVRTLTSRRSVVSYYFFERHTALEHKELCTNMEWQLYVLYIISSIAVTVIHSSCGPLVRNVNFSPQCVPLCRPWWHSRGTLSVVCILTSCRS